MFGKVFSTCEGHPSSYGPCTNPSFRIDGVFEVIPMYCKQCVSGSHSLFVARQRHPHLKEELLVIEAHVR